MSTIKLIHNILFIAEAILCAYMVFDLIYKKNKFKNGKTNEIKNTKYMIIIILIVAMFEIYGYMRNII